MKKIIIFCLLFISISNLWSQSLINSKSNVAYRNALEEFENKNYGKALNYAEDAIRFRNQQIKDEIKKLEYSLSTKDVKSAGDNIDNVIEKLKSRDEQDCVNIINLYIKKKGKDYFNNSIANVISYIKKQDVFPEALRLIGDIYKIEGEYEFAEQYYLRALENSEYFDIPDEKYSILYTMAELSRLSGNYEQMETRLLNITTSAQQNRNKSLMNSMRKVISANRNDSVEKLFSMYRNTDYYNLDAYCQLANYYLENNKLDKAIDYCSLAVITGFTKMINLISKRDMVFEYKNLENFLLQVPNYEDIKQWGINNKVWESFNLLAKLCIKANYNVTAYNLLKILSKASPDKYWQKEAVILLDTIDGIK